MNRKHLIYTLILALLPMLAASCVADGIEPCPAEPDAPGYLTLAVSTATTSRAADHPYGGEKGDGYEHGRGKENAIHNLTLFLYRDLGAGLDGDYSILWSKYVDAATVVEANPALPIDQIYNIRIPLQESDFQYFRDGAGYDLRVLVIANAGDLTQRYSAYSSIKSICRDASYTFAAWTPPAEGGLVTDSDYFVMSSAFNGAKRTDSNRADGLIRVVSTATDGTVYSGSVTLERVAARIDLRVTPDNITDDNKIQYTVQGTSGNTLTLLNAIPVNLMQQRSYLVKQVATTFDATWQAAGDETKDANGHPTNYVITPDFLGKPIESSTSQSDVLTGWFGNSRASYLRDLTDYNMEPLSPISSELVGSSFQILNENTTDRAIIISYANENTHSEQAQLTSVNGSYTRHPSDYLTGLLFRAQYHPAKIYTTGAVGPDAPVQEYKDGDDFWLFRTVADNVSEANNLYFASAEALASYVATRPLPPNPTGNEYETQKYEGGICYYNVWIRHANTDVRPEENFPMKYGIVRNNIYRISLNFHGIGQPTPEIVEPQAVTARIFVIKWNFRPQPEIIM